MDIKLFKKKVLQLDPNQFKDLAIEAWSIQAAKNPAFKRFLSLMNYTRGYSSQNQELPLLPIELFKDLDLNWHAEEKSDIDFLSSGTTGQSRSKHRISDPNFYQELSAKIFEKHMFKLEGLPLLALLPNYQEQGNSSLIFMIQSFIEKSKNPYSGFYKDDNETLLKNLKALESKRKPYLLFGVSYALLDLIANQKMSFQHALIVETGGMKGRKKELTREDLHQQLCKGFGVEEIFGEYGMTELLSQAWSKGLGVYDIPASMKILIKDPMNPIKTVQAGQRGRIGIVDLGNIDSCSFILSDDLGLINSKGQLEILGRIDQSDIRGCNLLMA